MKYNDALDKLLEETASSFFGDMDEEPKETVISKAPTTSGEQIFSDKEYRYALENKALPKYRLYLEKKNRKDSPAYLHCRKLEQDLLDVYFRYENTKEWFRSQQEILVPAIDCYLSDAEKRITRARSFDPEFADELQQEEGPAMLYLTQILDFLTSGELPDETVVQAPESSGKINVALLSTALSSYSLQLEVFRKPGAPDHRKCMELSKMLINTYFDQDPSPQWFEENRMFVEPAIDELISSYYDALLSADPEETNTALINRRREDASHLRDLIAMKKVYTPDADFSRYEDVLDPKAGKESVPALMKFAEKFFRDNLYIYVQKLADSKGKTSGEYRRARDFHMDTMGLLDKPLTMERLLPHKAAVLSFLDCFLQDAKTTDSQKASLSALRKLLTDR